MNSGVVKIERFREEFKFEMLERGEERSGNFNVVFFLFTRFGQFHRMGDFGSAVEVIVTEE